MSTAPDSPKASKLGSLGSSFWLVLLALSVILFGANTGVATYEGSRLSGAGTGAADLQVLSQQLANQGREAVEGNAEAFKSFKATKSQIESTVGTLRSRFGSEGAVSGALSRLEATWAGRADGERSQAWMDRQRGKITGGIAAMAKGLGDKPFCSGIHLSLSDIAVGCALGWIEFRFPDVEWRAQ